jgi:hypothetical protein
MFYKLIPLSASTSVSKVEPFFHLIQNVGFFHFVGVLLRPYFLVAALIGNPDTVFV